MVDPEGYEHAGELIRRLEQLDPQHNSPTPGSTRFNEWLVHRQPVNSIVPQVGRGATLDEALEDLVRNLGA